VTTRTLAPTDALGDLVRFVPPPGRRFDTVVAAPSVERVASGGLIADEALDSNDVIADPNERGAEIVVTQHPRRTEPVAI
jgi:hypothetical protein